MTSQVPEPRLIDAAHIVMDGDEQLGQPIASRLDCRSLNFIMRPSTPDRVASSRRPVLELGVKGMSGTLIDRPNRIEDRPDRDRLAIRF